MGWLMRGDYLGSVERRRRWSAAQKEAVVLASFETGAVVTDVARRFGVTRQQVYDWRRAARNGRLVGSDGPIGYVEVMGGLPGCVAPGGANMASLPVRSESVASPGMEPRAIPTRPAVEIVLAGGRMLRVPADMPSDDLCRLIRAVEGA
jgi:transposase